MWGAALLSRPHRFRSLYTRCQTAIYALNQPGEKGLPQLFTSYEAISSAAIIVLVVVVSKRVQPLCVPGYVAYGANRHSQLKTCYGLLRVTVVTWQAVDKKNETAYLNGTHLEGKVASSVQFVSPPSHLTLRCYHALHSHYH